MKQIVPLLLVLLWASCSKNDNAPDITTGLTVHLALDGNALDQVSQTTGTIYHATPTTNRNNEANKAMLFSQSDSAYIDMDDLAGASFAGDSFTIACWVKLDNDSSAMAVLSKRNGFSQFEYSLDNHFSHAVFNLDNWVANGSGTVYGVDPLSASAAVTADGNWHHIAYVADGSTMKVYVDGVLSQNTDTHQAGSHLGDTDAHLLIGNGGGYHKNYFFSGSIDDVRMYNRPLDASAIQALMGAE